MFGLFVAYLDRTNVSVGLPGLSDELGFGRDSATASLVLTAFLIGYLVANVLGGFLSVNISPKWTIVAMVAVFSASQLIAGWTHSVTLLVILRVILGFGEGVYWPQQFRLAKAWFTDHEMTRACAVIEFYGQYLSLALGFFLLTPVYNHLGWRWLFWGTGAAGLLLVVPLYIVAIKSTPRTTVVESIQPVHKREKLSLKAFGGPRFFLLVFSYFSNGLLFWGTTLFIPAIVKSLGFTGGAQGLASAIPYLTAIALTIPVTIISDRSLKRLPIAASGLYVSGLLLMALPFVSSPYGKLALISLALAYYASCYVNNIWATVTSDFSNAVVGPASGIINGFGAGGGGIVAGFVVGRLEASTGSFVPGFVVLGITAIFGGLATLLYAKLRTSAGQTGSPYLMVGS